MIAIPAVAVLISRVGVSGFAESDPLVEIEGSGGVDAARQQVCAEANPDLLKGVEVIATSPVEGDIAISVISVAELQFGVLVAPDDERRAHRLARLSAILRNFEPLPVDAGVAASYGELAAATHRAGRKSSARGLALMIAATAHAHGARLITANVDDVRHLVDLVDIVQG